MVPFPKQSANELSLRIQDATPAEEIFFYAFGFAYKASPDHFKALQELQWPPQTWTLDKKDRRLTTAEEELEELGDAPLWDETAHSNRDKELRELFEAHYGKLITGRKRFGKDHLRSDWRRAQENFPEAACLHRKAVEEEEEEEFQAKKESDKLEREAKRQKMSH